MSNQRRSRKRAVRLIPAALQRLKIALHERWRKERGNGKLTRETRAELLGVSVATSERILAGEGVDRPTLTLVFKSLGLDWDDSYCEVECDEPQPVAEAEAPKAVPLVPVPRTSSLRVKRLLIAGGVLCALFAAAGQLLIPAMASGPHASDQNWAYTYNKLLLAGSEDFHRGNYKDARSQIHEAIQLARAHAAPRALASALRISGDLAFAEGSFEEAKTRYSEALTLRGVFLEDVAEPALLEALGDLETRTGDYDSAKGHLTRSLKRYRDFKDGVGVAMAARNLGTLAFETKDLEDAIKWFTASLEAVKGLGKPDIETDIQGRMALVSREKGNYAQARSELNECLSYWTKRNHPRWMAQTEYQLGTVEAMAGNFQLARELLNRSKRGFEEVGDKAGSAETAAWIARVSGTPPFHPVGFRARPSPKGRTASTVGK